MSVFDQMINRGHERVAFHHDPATGLRAIVAIHNTVLGNALGGTRRWYYETEEDALYDVLRLSHGRRKKRDHDEQTWAKGHRSRGSRHGPLR
jgi:leucine dehydrogenase